MKRYLRLIGILLFIIILININLAAVCRCLLQANGYTLLLVMLINVFVVLLRAWRWVKLVEIQNYKLGFVEAFWSYLRSLYLGNVTPARVGELSRAYYLMKYVNTNSATAISSIIFDRVLDMYFMLILGIIGLITSNVWGDQYWIKAVFPLLMVLIAIFIVFPNITLTIAKKFPNWFDFRAKFVEWLQNFFDGIKSFLSVKVVFPVILTIFVYLLFLIQCFLLAYSMNLKIDFFYLAFCIAVFSTLSILPISVSNMGTREFVLIFMFSYVGFSSDLAVSYSLLFFITINLILAILGWLTFVFYTDKVALEDVNLCVESE